MIARVSNKGQITIPISERRRLGIEPNSKVQVIPCDGGIEIRPIKSVLEVAGSLRRYAKFPVPDWDEVRRETYRALSKEAVNADRAADPGD
ncbi:MAG: AbrB/MazE/SpoVT family DNA-binding domain-containing protein [Armatimonadetes bacterium]|nr:AbrB/MazE/SpoVT family DNA-binding domain-containing protein [Armatimonadota bacterium]